MPANHRSAAVDDGLRGPIYRRLTTRNTWPSATAM